MNKSTRRFQPSVVSLRRYALPVLAFLIAGAALGQATISSFTANTTFPKRVGTSITWTATGAGGTAPLQYQFNRYSYATGQWSVVRAYSTTRTYSWTPTNADIGRYILQVYVRSNGSTAPYESYANTPDFDLIGAPPTITALTANVTFPTPAGQPITWTATATGGVPPLQYAFTRYTASTGQWIMAQPYSSNNTFTWIPQAGDVGQFQVQVWVLNANETIPYSAVRTSALFTINAPVPLAIAALNSYPPVPKPHGSIILWSPVTSGGIQPLSYGFWRYSNATGAWTMVQDYSTNSTFTWTPSNTEVGDYQMAVWIKNSGSTAQYDAFIGTPQFSITPPDSDIIRFLEQATFGPTDYEIARVRAMGMSAWIDDQFNQPASGLPTYPLVPDTPAASCTGTCNTNNYTLYLPQRQMFTNALYAPDQLHQRVAWALHSLVVVSGLDFPMPSWYQPYFDIIYRNAFGNYQQILNEVTLNPAMGEYLNLDTNRAQGLNENYAREIMQLFSIGTDTLNLDGTPKTLADGTIIPTYDQFIVTELARALTCWRFQPQISPGVTNYRDPMQCTTANHDLGSKTLVNGSTTAAGASPLQDLTDSMNAIYYHPNVGPYIAKHLIRRMVTSNPSPAYVARVATVFNNNGSGVRGDMKAVVKAILLDSEARVGPTSRRTLDYGHLKEPFLMVTQLLRAVGAKSANGQTTSDGYLEPTVFTMGQSILRPSTVFSYYPAENQLPNSSLKGPEFGLFDSTTALRRANFVNTMVFSTIPVSANAPNGTSLDLTMWTFLANNPNALVKEIDRLFFHDTMSAGMRGSLLTAINAVPATNLKLRAQTALYLAATSSQYQVEQ